MRHLSDHQPESFIAFLDDPGGGVVANPVVRAERSSSACGSRKRSGVPISIESAGAWVTRALPWASTIVGPVHEATQATQHLVSAGPGGQVFLPGFERQNQRGLEPGLGHRPGDFHQAFVEFERIASDPPRNKSHGRSDH